MSDYDSENYLTPAELRRIADMCEAFTPVWEILTTTDTVSAEMLDGVETTLYDSNGDTLGYINWADNGAAFYPHRKN